MVIGRSFIMKFYACCISVIAFLLLFGCSSSGPAPVVTGQALLGPLTGAEVDVYHYDDLKASIYSTTTSESTNLADAGLFDIPESILEEDALYVIKISGGNDIDADDDGIIDVFPTDNLGTLHLVATGSQLLADNFKANILTDITYHKIAYLLLAKYSRESILQELELYSRRLLKNDVDGDGDRNLDDLFQWDPVYDKDKVSREWSFFEKCISGICLSG